MCPPSSLFQSPVVPPHQHSLAPNFTNSLVTEIQLRFTNFHLQICTRIVTGAGIGVLTSCICIGFKSSVWSFENTQTEMHFQYP